MASHQGGLQPRLRRTVRSAPALLPAALAAWGIATAATHAFVVTQPASRRLGGPQATAGRRGGRTTVRAAGDGRSWQQSLDEALLDVDAAPEARLRSLREALRDPVEIARDLGRAVGAVAEKGLRRGHPEALDALWPKGTTARSDLEGLAALGRQLPELARDFQNLERPSFQGSGSSPSLDTGDLSGSLPSLLDEEKRREIFEEAMNVFRRTPRGLEEPAYTVVRELANGTQLRRYEPFAVAQRTMPDGSGKAYSSAEGFTSLAGYLFGDNANKTAMEMTMPVEISFGAADATANMSFVLPKAYAGTAPAPNDASVQLVEVPGRLVAAKAFAGVATAGEVERQRRTLEEVLAAEAFEPVDADAYSVLQYNPPYTLPWRRRNEIAVVVQEPAAAGEPGAEPAPSGAEAADAPAAAAAAAEEPLATPAPEQTEA